MQLQERGRLKSLNETELVGYEAYKANIGRHTKEIGNERDWKEKLRIRKPKARQIRILRFHPFGRASGNIRKSLEL